VDILRSFTMQHFKFLLFGITGDLSKRKVLPAISEFADLNKEDVSVELIGYSRSQPDALEIGEILNKYNELQKHNLTAVSFLQGEYSDGQFLQDLITGLKENEKLVIYLAVPPLVFGQLLENFCPYYTANIDIIIEKPFGSNLKEANRLFEIIEKCHLENKTHFMDHFVFKTSAILDQEILLKIKNNPEFKLENLKQVKIQALEQLALEGRAGFYDKVGAIQDYLPSHMVSLLEVGLKVFGITDPGFLDSLKVQDLSLGQYKSYIPDLGNNQQSQTETYFKIDSQIIIENNSIDLILETGKKFGFKKTEIEFEFKNGEKIIWNLDTKRKIEFQNEIVDLNLNTKLDHVNAFEDILNKNYERFIDRDMIIEGWKVYNQVIDFKEKNNVEVRKYEDNKWPIEFDC
jgi:glucose-6-phosphate 1-dehydrogenase